MNPHEDVCPISAQRSLIFYFVLSIDENKTPIYIYIYKVVASEIVMQMKSKPTENIKSAAPAVQP